MKKFGMILFILFIFFGALYAILQSNIGRDFTRKLLTSALENSGYDVKISRVDGTLPSQIDLKGVSVLGDGIDIQIEEVKLRLILWRLLKKEVAFNSIHARNISWKKGAPFDFNGKFRMNRKKGYLRGSIADWKINARLDRPEKKIIFAANGELLQAKGNALFNADYQLQLANLQIESNRLFEKLPFSASGKIVSNTQVYRTNDIYEISAKWKIPTLKLDNTKISSVEGEGKAVWQNNTLKGNFGAKGKILKDLWSANTDFSWTEENSLFLSSLKIDSPRAKGSADLEIRPDWLLVGKSEFELESLQAIQLPNFYGKIKAKADWHILDEKQGVKLDAAAADFYWGALSAQKISIYSDLMDPFGKVTGLADLQIEKGKWEGLEIEIASLQTSSGKENWPFHLFAEGKWTHPIEVTIDGTWKDFLTIDLQSLNGTFYNHPFTLEKPVMFKRTETTLLISDTSISIAGAKAFFNLTRDSDRTDARLRLKKMPIDFLSLNPLEVPVAGTLNLEASVLEENNKLKGGFEASIDDLEVGEKGRAAGQFTGQFDRERLTLKGDLTTRNAQLLKLDLSLPIQFSMFPFQYEIYTHKPARGLITLNGRIEDFLDFFNLGPHRLEGDCTCQLALSNTLYQPNLKGNCQFRKGYYQNYYTGTELYDIEADLLAKKDQIFLQSFTAKDFPRTGSISGNGEMAMRLADLFPFKLDLAISDFQFVEIDLVSAKAEGKMHIEGNASSALAQGEIYLVQSDLQIPDHIPHPLPNLQVVYKNTTHPIIPEQPPGYKPYPLFLDLNVTAPNGVTIGGRGLSSEWNGEFHLGGTFTDLAAKGKLDLIDGEFNFSSRSFKLTEGSLSLSGKEHEMPYINLAGTMTTKGITIIARLKGPLNNPQITLQSTPPLPLSSIMSHLLFGQDLSEISGFQAFQLATSLASLAGTGPDIMESTRRSLGVDRLRVITDPTDEGGESIAIQVGKYVSKGVLVSFTQGTEDRGTNISIEVEIKDNFVLQLESDQQPAPQGKFSLKWNLNY